MELPYAEDCSYWKTSKSGVEGWLDKTERLIEQIEGEVITRIAGKSGGKEAIMFVWELKGEQYKLMWPVLPTKKDERSAAMRQAATMIYHDTKARINRLKIFPPEVVFSDWLVLPNGQTIAESRVEGIPQNLLLLGN